MFHLFSDLSSPRGLRSKIGLRSIIHSEGSATRVRRWTPDPIVRGVVPIWGAISVTDCNLTCLIGIEVRTVERYTLLSGVPEISAP